MKRINDMIENQFTIISNKLNWFSKKADIFDNLKSMTLNFSNVKEFFNTMAIPNFFTN